MTMPDTVQRDAAENLSPPRLCSWVAQFLLFFTNSSVCLSKAWSRHSLKEYSVLLAPGFSVLWTLISQRPSRRRGGPAARATLTVAASSTPMYRHVLVMNAALVRPRPRLSAHAPYRKPA